MYIFLEESLLQEILSVWLNGDHMTDLKNQSGHETKTISFRPECNIMIIFALKLQSGHSWKCSDPNPSKEFFPHILILQRHYLLFKGL